jgi:hypothetical protein
MKEAAMTKAAVKRKTFLRQFAQIWRRNGSEGVPVRLAVDPSQFTRINLEELQKWREFRLRGDDAAADQRQAKVSASLVKAGGSLLEARVQIEGAAHRAGEVHLDI